MSDDKAIWPPIDPISAGLRGRCPRCGEGRLFSGFLSVGKRCTNCGLDYSYADAGDGPAVFVILIIGFIVVGLALWVEVTLSPPLWLHLLLWIPLTLVLCLGALRLIKGVLLTLQYSNKAAEGRLDRGAMSEASGTIAGRSRPKTALMLGLGLVLFFILLALGTWQVQRLHWKEGLLADHRSAHAFRAAAPGRGRTTVRRDR